MYSWRCKFIWDQKCSKLRAFAEGDGRFTSPNGHSVIKLHVNTLFLILWSYTMIRVISGEQKWSLRDFYRAMLCIRGTSHGPVSVRLSVCLSVRPSQVGVLLKRLNVGSHKQHHTIPKDSSFLMPKISAKFDRGHHLRGRQMQVGRVKIGDFRQVAGYISKTVKDRHIVSVKVE